MARKINYDNWSKEELIKELRRIKETKYGLVWHRDLPEEKIDILINPDARTPSEMFPNEMAGRPFPILKEIKSKEINGDTTKPVNLLIEGDNYHSLAVLNFTHQEAIDCIYIDPPYNRGGDFLYTDKYKSDYVQKEDPFRHSKWISFMEKRLKLARNLLSKSGVLFISIDDSEFAPLRMLCDEIFGGEFVDVMIWRKSGDGRYGKMKNTTTFRKDHEYIIVCFKKERRLNKLKEIPQFLNEYGNPDNDPRGPFKAGSISRKETASNPHHKNYYEVVSPSSKKFKRQFDVSKNKFLELDKDKRIYWGRNNNAVPAIKIFLQEERRITPYSVLLTKGTTTEGTEELNTILGGDYSELRPKPSTVIKTLIQLGSKEDSTVIDFFAGSGTTGQAVLQLNKADRGNRKFILCTNNENKICTDVCYPRIKKVGSGYKNAKGEKIPGLDTNLKYYVCDFVEAEPTDRNKRKLVNESTEMLCIRENTFELVQDERDFKIFKNRTNYIGIIFYEEAIGDFKKAIKKIKGHFNTYVFSLGDDPHEKQFADVKSKVTLCAIPEVVLKVYREIFK